MWFEVLLLIYTIQHGVETNYCKLFLFLYSLNSKNNEVLIFQENNEVVILLISATATY